MRNYLNYIFVVMVVWVAVACGKSDLNGNGTDDLLPEKRFNFTINMQVINHESSSRAQMIGDDFETWIDKDKLHVLIYSDNMDYVGEIEQIIPGTYSTSGGVFTFNFTGKTALELTVGQSYRFMIITNSTLPSGKDKKTVPTYSLTTDIDPTTGAIPMWGVTTHQILDQKEQAIASTQLVRAVAKIELVMSENLKNSGFSFNKVQLTNYAQTGNAFPKKWAESGTTSTDVLTQNNPDTNIFNPDESSLNHNDVRYFSATDASNTDFVTYVPEYAIPTTGDANVPFVNVEVKKDGKTYTFVEVVKFNDPKFYSSTPNTTDPNKFHNIVRNNNYKFVVKSISAGHTVDLDCMVQPWDLYKEELDYENYISVLEGGKIKWTALDYPYEEGVINDKKKVYITDDGIQCTFGLSTPKGATWYAVLVPVKGSFDAYTFVETVDGKEKNVGLTTRGPVGKLKTLTIKQTNDIVNETNIMRLKIYVKDRNNKTFVVKNDLLGGEYYIVQTVK